MFGLSFVASMAIGIGGGKSNPRDCSRNRKKEKSPVPLNYTGPGDTLLPASALRNARALTHEEGNRHPTNRQSKRGDAGEASLLCEVHAHELILLDFNNSVRPPAQIFSSYWSPCNETDQR